MVRSSAKAKAEADASRRRRFAYGGSGRALENDKKRDQKRVKEEYSAMMRTGVAASQQAKSILEQTSLDDFISAAELGQQTFDGVRGNHLMQVDFSARLVTTTQPKVSTAEQERAAAARRCTVPIPRRPEWDEEMEPEELAEMEAHAFLAWRRRLAEIEQGEGLIMTPYERNLDFWRQLWRCVERCDVLVQILDARDPEFYRCHDLERYVNEIGQGSKRMVLLVNKADFLTPELRRRWKETFAAAGVDHMFFSALRELHRQQRLPKAEDNKQDSAEPVLPPHGNLADADDGEVLDCGRLLEELISRVPEREKNDDESDEDDRGVVGFVGYPNVGKSSVINALFGAKKVSMSRTPGKTKHLQTLNLPDVEITLCDCPGLVFPSVVATKAHLVINGTVPITELREAMPPARLVVEKLGIAKMMEKYTLPEGALQEGAKLLGDDDVSADPQRAFMAALAATRNHYLRLHVPDEGWAARKVLRDYVTGALLHCEQPSAFAPPPRGNPTASSGAVEQDAQPAASASAAPAAAPEAAEASDDDFSDLEDFLNERGGGKEITKRGARKQNKKMQKGGAALLKEQS